MGRTIELLILGGGWLKLGSKRGVTGIEYALLAALIAVMIVSGVAKAGASLKDVFNTIGANVHIQQQQHGHGHGHDGRDFKPLAPYLERRFRCGCVGFQEGAREGHGATDHGPSRLRSHRSASLGALQVGCFVLAPTRGQPDH